MTFFLVSAHMINACPLCDLFCGHIFGIFVLLVGDFIAENAPQTYSAEVLAVSKQEKAVTYPVEKKP